MKRTAATTVRMPEPGAPGRAPLWKRFMAYQAERFPLAGFVPLITLFTVASAGFSRLARHAPGMVSTPLLVVGSFTSLASFFILRVLDEHKDADDDRRYRPELPVPRGLVTLAELRALGTRAGLVALALNALLAPVMLLPLALVAAWATLMTREFFVRAWLRTHATAYLLTHMAIMPLIDGYTTGLDWLPAGHHPPVGVLWFLAVTFANGVLIEIGRKLRAPADERPGVDTYTRVWGVRVAPCVWVVTLGLSAWLSLRAAEYVSWPAWAVAAFVSVAVVAALPALRFAVGLERGDAVTVERVSQAWPALTYLSLGVLPLVARMMLAR